MRASLEVRQRMLERVRRGLDPFSVEEQQQRILAGQGRVGTHPYVHRRVRAEESLAVLGLPDLDPLVHDVLGGRFRGCRRRRSRGGWRWRGGCGGQLQLPRTRHGPVGVLRHAVLVRPDPDVALRLLSDGRDGQQAGEQCHAGFHGGSAYPSPRNLTKTPSLIREVRQKSGRPPPAAEWRAPLPLRRCSRARARPGAWSSAAWSPRASSG